tara:strand:+ start:81 stop:413 length:333 start_codon:yes stop_codon:yes gene_type:complete
MRLINSNAKTDIWNCRITIPQEGEDNDIVKVDKNYSTLKEMGDDLGMTYSQITDLKNKRSQRKQIRFKFHPVITIKRIKETQKEHYDNKRKLKLKSPPLLEEDNSIPCPS